MKIIRREDIMAVKNPDPGEKFHRTEILTAAEGANNLGGLIQVVAPGVETTHHYHNIRESVIVIVDGEATEIVDGKEYELKAGDVVYLKAKEKHFIRNKSSKGHMRYIEFYTEPPVNKDYVAVT